MLACSVLLLTACGPVGDGDDSGTSGSGGAARDGGTMTVALADDPDLLNPTLARTLVARMVFMSMCEKLYDIDQKLNVVPQLAASPPTISQDGRSAEIKLRQGVWFNDDTPLDAEAVKKSLDRHRTLEGSQRKSELLAVTGVDVVDPATVRIRLSQPFAPLAGGAGRPFRHGHVTQAARRARRRLRQFRTIELLAPRPVKSAADNLMRSLPDIWSHEAEPEPTPDYHHAADAYMAAARADLGAPD